MVSEDTHATLVDEQPLQDVAYVHDGTLEGLLSAVFLAYERHEDPADIVPARQYQPRLLQSSITVQTDVARAMRVRRGVERACGKAAFTAVLRASTCEDYGTGAIIYRFIRYAMAREASARNVPILDEMANPTVSDLLRLSRHAINETEKMRQFVRFSQLEGGIWFSKVSPNASVVPLVMGYFSSRLNDQPFIIYDERHQLAGVYDGRTWQLIRDHVPNLPAATADEKRMQQAWKAFYDAVSIDPRYNPELRRHFMPKRLWSNLCELHPKPAVSESPELIASS